MPNSIKFAKLHTLNKILSSLAIMTTVAQMLQFPTPRKHRPFEINCQIRLLFSGSVNLRFTEAKNRPNPIADTDNKAVILLTS